MRGNVVPLPGESTNILFALCRGGCPATTTDFDITTQGRGYLAPLLVNLYEIATSCKFHL